ncbi:MAG: molybdenum cofactor guanylyltransferase MobA [Chloroflexota bacterium]
MEREAVTAIVLCGGSGRRLGRLDKTMAPLRGRPLVEHTLEALAPQVGRLIISCGRDCERYELLGYATAADERTGEGPLGGIVSALPLVQTEWLLTYPGDAPFADPSLVRRLAPAAEHDGLAVPRAGDDRQHLVMLLSRGKTGELERFYRAGGRAARVWLDQQGVASVDMSDSADSFFNVNTPADLALAERRLTGARTSPR